MKIKMRQIFLFFFVLFLLTNCSFDNKSGIWSGDTKKQVSNPKNPKSKDIGKLTKNRKFKLACAFIKSRKEFEECQTGIKKGIQGEVLEVVFSETKLFDQEKNVSLTTKINIEPAIKNKNWQEKYLNSSNNISNIFYSNQKEIILKSSKLSKRYNDDNAIIYRGNFISYDHKGFIYIYSPKLKKKIFEYNFYKKNFKKYKKKISLIVNDGIIYAADNLGYIYSISINEQRILWAQNYGIPFRSNIKIVDNQIIVSNQDNIIYSINKIDGEKNWQLATSYTFLKSDFQNNIVIDKINKNILFINTSGELYSINYENRKINYMLNFNNFALGGGSDLFQGLPISLKDGNLLASTGTVLLNYDAQTASRKWVSQVSVKIKPIITENNIFLITKNKLLVCLDLKTGQILWSKKIYGQIENIKEKKRNSKLGTAKDLIISGQELLILTSNGFLLSFNYKNGKLNSFKKISRSKIASRFSFAEGKMYLMNNNNKLFIYR
tara:strand:+ start:325 stop:1803 length:1479 start_codon:yes stop_codon:yes gene_type:complete